MFRVGTQVGSLLSLLAIHYILIFPRLHAMIATCLLLVSCMLAWLALTVKVIAICSSNIWIDLY
jgi:hypothetical protein